MHVLKERNVVSDFGLGALDVIGFSLGWKALGLPIVVHVANLVLRGVGRFDLRTIVSTKRLSLLLFLLVLNLMK